MELARELVKGRGPSPAKAFVLSELARALMMADDPRAFELAAESLHLAEELGLEATRSRNLNTIGCGKVKSGDRSGLADLERAIEIGAAVNSHEEVSAMANLQTMVSLLGDLRRAAELQEQTLTAARRQVVPGFIRWQEAEAAMHAYWQGRWPDALAQADAFIAASEAGEAHYMDPVCRYIRGAISLAQGHTQAALADGRRATELARAIKDPQALNPAIAFEGTSSSRSATSRPRTCSRTSCWRSGSTRVLGPVGIGGRCLGAHGARADRRARGGNPALPGADAVARGCGERRGRGRGARCGRLRQDRLRSR